MLRRASRGGLASLIVAAAILGTAGPASAASYPDAIVLVSGVESSTPFSTPDPSCAGQEGKAWSPEVAKTLRAQGFSVFTAPVTNKPVLPPSCNPDGPDVGASETVDSNGDIDANGRALLAFLSFIEANYGVTSVQLVGHSDGGLWSRSAIAKADQAGLPITSLTTIGTPHTGSFLADVAVGASNFPCGDTLPDKLRCATIGLIAKRVFKNIGQTAITQLSSPFLMGWNAQQGIGSCPVTLIAGTKVDDTKDFPDASTYYTPSDGLVGLASAFNQGVPALDGSTIPAAPGLNVVTRTSFPDTHTPALGQPDELSDPAVAAAVATAVGAGSTAPCAPAPSPAPPTPPVVPVHVWTASTPGHLGRFALSARGDAIFTTRRGTVRCGHGRVESHPVRSDPRLKVSYPGRCRGRLSADPGGALLVHAVRRISLAVKPIGRLVRIVERRGRLREMKVEVRAGKRWRRAALDDRGRVKVGRRASALRISGLVGKGGRPASGTVFLAD